MKGIRGALCFHSALHSAPMLFFPWPLLPRAREEFDKVTPGPHYLFFCLHLPSLSQILIVRLAGLYCLSSHQWGHTFGLPLLPPPQNLACHLFCCWNDQWTSRCDSISYTIRLMYRTNPSPIDPCVFQLPALLSSLALFLTEPEPSGWIFLCHTLLKHTFISRGIALWQNTLSFSFPFASLCDLFQP